MAQDKEGYVRLQFDTLQGVQMKPRQVGPIGRRPRTRFLQFCLGLAMSLAIATTGCSQMCSSFDDAKEAAMREMLELAEAAAVLLNVYMDARVTDMLVGSSLGGPLRDALTVPEARADANRILKEWLKISKSYEAILLLDKNGRCLASAPEGLVNQDFSDDEAFRGAEKGQLTVTDAHKSDVLISLDPRSNGWTAAIAVPVKVKNEVEGVLMSFLSWSQLGMLMKGVGVGKTSYVFVVNRRNQIIIGPIESSYGVSLRDPKINLLEVDDAITRKAPNSRYEFREMTTNRLIARLQGFAYPKGCGNFQGLGWTVGVSAYEIEIMAVHPFWLRLCR